MITVGMNYVVKNGKQSAFEEKFDAVLDALHSTSDHVDSHMYRDIHDDRRYLIVSEWSSRQAFAEFIRSDAFKDVTSWGKEQILEGRPRHKVYQDVPDAEPSD